MGTAQQNEPYPGDEAQSTSAGIPEPPVPEEVDLRKLPWMPLYVNQLQNSTFGMTSSLAGFGAAVRLWMYAWTQPRSSLPKDDRILARVCGLRSTDREWKAVRDEALTKFFECSDGRLYHPFLVEAAIDAWERFCRRSQAGKRGAEKRWHGNAIGKGHSNANAVAMAPNSTGQDRTGQDSIEPTSVGSMSGKEPRRPPRAPVAEIIGYLNKRAGTGFSPKTKSTVSAVTARWSETQNIKRYKLVIDYLCATWMPDPEMAGYIRPSTIFRESKFEGYAEAAIRWAEKTGYAQEEDE